MITVLYGEDTVSSRNYLTTLRRSYSAYEQIEIDAAKAVSEDLIQALQPQSLFSASRLVVVENGFKKIDLITGSGAEVVLWEDGNLTSSLLSKLPKGTKVMQFKPPVTVFKFLDSLRPTSASSLSLLHKTLSAGADPSLIFNLTLKRVHTLLLYMADPAMLRMQEWQVVRLGNQATDFGFEKLLEFYKELVDIDWSLKRGKVSGYMAPLETVLSQI